MSAHQPTDAATHDDTKSNQLNVALGSARNLHALRLNTIVVYRPNHVIKLHPARGILAPSQRFERERYLICALLSQRYEGGQRASSDSSDQFQQEGGVMGQGADRWLSSQPLGFCWPEVPPQTLQGCISCRFSLFKLQPLTLLPAPGGSDTPTMNGASGAFLMRCNVARAKLPWVLHGDLHVSPVAVLTKVR